jgi:AAHS family 4-hydroxybenzoate transporter-like MFS transporter
LFGSLLLAMHIPVQQIFFFCAIPAVIAALLIIQVRSPMGAAPQGPDALLAPGADHA